jgi:hypothetical protein
MACTNGMQQQQQQSWQAVDRMGCGMAIFPRLLTECEEAIGKEGRQMIRCVDSV